MTFFTLLIPIMAILSNKPITDATNSSPPLAVAHSPLPHPPKRCPSPLLGRQSMRSHWANGKKQIEKGRMWNFF
jgi:hypothetical protein